MFAGRRSLKTAASSCRASGSLRSCAGLSHGHVVVGTGANFRRAMHTEGGPLSLQQIDPCIFVAPKEILWRPPNARGVYGGQIVGQAMVAGSMTVDNGSSRVLTAAADGTGGGGAVDDCKSINSMQALFLSPGNSEQPIIFFVNKLRDGKAFSTRSIVAKQAGKAILTCQLSFHRHEPSPCNHQDAMPAVPSPESLPSMQDRFQTLLDDRRLPEALKPVVKNYLDAPFPIDVRAVTYQDPLAPKKLPAVQHVWMKSREPIGDDANMHRCAAAFASDWSICWTSFLPHGLGPGSPRISHVASLDHVMHFHSAFRADEWCLYSMTSPRMEGSRGLNHGQIFRSDGVLAMSCTQEALARVRS